MPRFFFCSQGYQRETLASYNLFNSINTTLVEVNRGKGGGPDVDTPFNSKEVARDGLLPTPGTREPKVSSDPRHGRRVTSTIRTIAAVAFGGLYPDHAEIVRDPADGAQSEL